MSKELVNKKDNLPSTIEENITIFVVGTAKRKAYEAKLKAQTELNIATEQLDATLADGQECGNLVLFALANVGKLAKTIPQEKVAGSGRGNKKAVVSEKLAVLPSKADKLKLSKSELKIANALSAHPEAVEQIIAESKEERFIPNPTDVIKQIARNIKESKPKENPDINDVVLKMAKDMQAWFNSFDAIVDQWENVSPEAKKKLGSKFVYLNDIFQKLKEKDSTKNKKHRLLEDKTEQED